MRPATWVRTRHRERHDTRAADTQPPTAPSEPAATAVSSTQVNLCWTASTDNVAVTGTAWSAARGGCTNFAQIATPAGDELQRHGPGPRTSYSYRVRAVDAAGNLSGYSRTRARRRRLLRTPRRRRAPSNLPATAVEHDPGQPLLDRVHRQRRGHRLPGRALPGAACSNFAQIATADGTTLQRHRACAAHQLLLSGARGRRGPQPGRLLEHGERDDAATRASWPPTRFNEGAGTERRRRVRERQHGHDRDRDLDDLGGKYGSALAFNGTNARVTIPDAPSCASPRGMTLEAWVYPGVSKAPGATSIYKGDDDYLLATSMPLGAYRQAAASSATGAPVETFGTSDLALNTWTHLAVTYDGRHSGCTSTACRSRAKASKPATSQRPRTRSQIGGDTFYGQYFTGRSTRCASTSRPHAGGGPGGHEQAALSPS